MSNLIVTGKLANAPECVTIVTVSGPNGYSHQETIKGNINMPLQVSPGLYSIYVHGKTDGILTLNITGSLSTVLPNVPTNLTGDTSIIFHATVKQQPII